MPEKRGLLSRGGAAQQQTGERRGGPAATPQTDDQPNVTPEEQSQYEQFVDRGYQAIYSPKSMPGVLQRLKGPEGSDPVDNLANTAAMVVLSLEDSARKAGVAIDEAVLLHGGTELLEDLGGLAGEAGIHDYSEQDLEAAMYRGLDTYREMRQAQGGIDQQRYAAEFQQLQQADQAGQLGGMLPPGTVERFASRGGDKTAARGGMGRGELPRDTPYLNAGVEG